MMGKRAISWRSTCRLAHRTPPGMQWDTKGLQSLPELWSWTGRRLHAAKRSNGLPATRRCQRSKRAQMSASKRIGGSCVRHWRLYILSINGHLCPCSADGTGHRQSIIKQHSVCGWPKLGVREKRFSVAAPLCAALSAFFGILQRAAVLRWRLAGAAETALTHRNMSPVRINSAKLGPV